MTIKFNGLTHKIFWRYEYEEKWSNPPFAKLLSKTPKGVATCTLIFDIDGRNISFEGFSECSKKDNFCYETARKLSLTRVLGEVYIELKKSNFNFNENTHAIQQMFLDEVGLPGIYSFEKWSNLKKEVWFQYNGRKG